MRPVPFCTAGQCPDFKFKFLGSAGRKRFKASFSDATPFASQISSFDRREAGRDEKGLRGLFSAWLQERVVRFLTTDGCAASVPGNHHGVFGQAH